jgi:HAD superfamily hydrolase (TIGR01549 family)
MPEGLSLLDFDAVLFDVDGTLVDSLSVIVQGLGDTFSRFANVRPADEEILSMIGMPLRKQLGMYSVMEPTPHQIEEMSQFAIERFETLHEKEQVFPAAVETLRFCHRRGLKTAFVTSKSAVELETFLARFEGAPYVHATVCASDVANPKPHPESAILACERLGVRRDRAVMVGDSIYDIRCARQAGVAAIAVAYGAAKRESLLAEEPNALFDTPEALLEWAQSDFLQPSCRARS